MTGSHPEQLEATLRRQLAGCRLVCELGLEGTLYKDLVRAMAEVISTGGRRSIQELSAKYPALLVAYLVAEGIHGYTAGNFWGKLLIPALRGKATVLGPQFAEALATLGLDDFEELVEEGANRYVSRILIHGGIPRYSLRDFFSLLLFSLRTGSARAADLVAGWRSQKTRFQGIDRPVERFLLRGGEVALDLLDRCIEMATEEMRTGSIPSAQTLGLPEYVVQAYRSLPTAERRSARTSLIFPRPRVELDPWDPFGPRMYLPPIPGELQGVEWRLNDGAGVTTIPAHTSRAARAALVPAFAWTVGLWRGYEHLRELAFQALEDMALLLFDPDDGRLIPSGHVLRLESVWGLHPRSGLLLTTDREGTAPLPIREEFPDPAGPWHGYVRRHYDLSGITAIFVHPQEGEPLMIRVVTPAQRPRLVGAPIEGVTTLEGHPVYADAPSLRVPPFLDVAPKDRLLVVRSSSGAAQLTLAELPETEDETFDIRPALAAVGRAGVYSLTLRGPLGSDVREEFALIPGVSVDRPTRPLLPSDGPVQVRVIAPSVDAPGDCERQVEVGDDADQTTLSFPLGGGVDLALRVSVPRILWSLDRTDDPRSLFGNQVLTTTAEEIVDGTVSALSVRAHVAGVPLVLALMDGERLLQASEQVATSGAQGRWTFELAPFAGTIRMTHASSLTFTLSVGGRRLEVVRVLARLKVEDVVASCEPVDGGCADVRLSFRQHRPLRGRVARLWSLERPWSCPSAEPLPDDDAQTVVIANVPFGRYLAEIACQDAWTTPSRPHLRAPNTAVIVVGDATQRLARINALDFASPFAVLEAAVASTRPLRPLTPDELREIAPAAAELVSLLIDEHGYRALATQEFERVASLLLAVPSALIESLAIPSLPPDLALKMGICFLPPLKVAASELDDSVMRQLWSTCPPLAAALDCPRVAYDHGSAARAETNLGWPSRDERDTIVAADAVPIQFASMDREQIDAIQREMALLPKRWLDADTRALAHLEWLVARCDRPDELTAWCDEHAGLGDTREVPPTLAEAVRQRRPLPQAPRWFSFPLLTLCAAAHLVHGTSLANPAAAALVAAISYGKRIVIRDLLLACVLEAQEGWRER